MDSFRCGAYDRTPIDYLPHYQGIAAIVLLNVDPVLSRMWAKQPTQIRSKFDSFLLISLSKDLCLAWYCYCRVIMIHDSRT